MRHPQRPHCKVGSFRRLVRGRDVKFIDHVSRATEFGRVEEPDDIWDINQRRWLRPTVTIGVPPADLHRPSLESRGTMPPAACATRSRCSISRSEGTPRDGRIARSHVSVVALLRSSASRRRALPRGTPPDAQTGPLVACPRAVCLLREDRDRVVRSAYRRQSELRVRLGPPRTRLPTGEPDVAR